MEFRKVLALRGPNIWANFTVLEAWVDLGQLKDSPSDELPGFNDRLMAWLPTMVEHRCSVGERGGFFERLRRGTYQAHILEHVTLELQTLAGSEVGYGRARETAEEGVYKVAVEYEEEEFARACLDTGRELCLAAVYDRPFDVAAAIEKLRKVYRRVRPEPGLAAVLQAARDRKIPIERRDGASLIQLGYGARQRRLWAGVTDRTSALAESIAQDGDLTRTLLQSVGIPVPQGRLANTADEAWKAAQELGVPVHLALCNGRRHASDKALSTRDQVMAAYQATAHDRASVWVERCAHGAEHSVLVVGGKVVSALRHEPDRAEATGSSNGAEPAPHTNGEGRNGRGQVGHAGCKFQPVTARVHAEVADCAAEAVQVVGLDIAEVRVIARDVGLPLEDQGGVVAGVNPHPDLGSHVHPGSDQRHPVGEAVVASLFAPSETGRIPIVAVTGVNGKTTITRLIGHILTQAGRRVGMTCTEGIYVNGRRIEAGDCSGPQSARTVLRNPDVDAAVLETARGGILREGLGFDLCDVAVVSNIGEGDHLGLCDIDTLEKLARVKRVPVEAVTPEGAAVLNAADALVAGMAEQCPGSVIFFGIDPADSVIHAHREAGGRAAFVRDGRIVLARGEHETVLAALADVPVTHGGVIRFQVENVLAAAAACWSLDVPAAVIRAGLASFHAGLDGSPGRFNVLEIHGATVIVDYGHNPSALASLIEAIEPFPQRQRSAVYSTAGDRRDEDIIRQGRMLGDAFDRVILYEDHYVRGRKAGEITALFRQGVREGRRVQEIQEIQGALKAVETALRGARPGELLLVQADEIDETVTFMRNYLAALESAGQGDRNRAATAMPAATVTCPS
jgi:cyanophycin synthetase